MIIQAKKPYRVQFDSFAILTSLSTSNTGANKKRFDNKMKIIFLSISLKYFFGLKRTT